MKDFLLNNNGDIMFEKSKSVKNSFEFNFFLSNAKSLLLNFFIENYNDFEYLDNLTPQLLFNFNIKKIEFDKDIIINSDEQDYCKQQIKIRLNTCINTLLENEDIGSKIYLYNHKMIKDDDTFEDIKSVVKEALADVFPEAEIQVNKIDTIYLDYSNSLMITIKIQKYNYYYYI